MTQRENEAIEILNSLKASLFYSFEVSQGHRKRGGEKAKRLVRLDMSRAFKAIVGRKPTPDEMVKILD